MPYSSLEDFIKAADAIGEVEYVEGADLERDVGCLTELLGERGGPMPGLTRRMTRLSTLPLATEIFSRA